MAMDVILVLMNLSACLNYLGWMTQVEQTVLLTQFHFPL